MSTSLSRLRQCGLCFETFTLIDPQSSERYQQEGRKEGNVLFNDALNTFYLRLYGVGHMVKDHSDSERGNTLPPHGLLFPINWETVFTCLYPFTVQTRPLAGTASGMASDSVRSRAFRLAARVLLYASSHRQDDTYHGLCYTSRGALATIFWN